MFKDSEQKKRKEVVKLKVGDDVILYALGLRPLGPKRLTIHIPAPSSKTGIFNKIAAHPEFVAAREKMNIHDQKSRRDFSRLCANIREKIVKSTQ